MYVCTVLLLVCVQCTLDLSHFLILEFLFILLHSLTSMKVSSVCTQIKTRVRIYIRVFFKTLWCTFYDFFLLYLWQTYFNLRGSVFMLAKSGVKSGYKNKLILIFFLFNIFIFQIFYLFFQIKCLLLILILRRNSFLDFIVGNKFFAPQTFFHFRKLLINLRSGHIVVQKQITLHQFPNLLSLMTSLSETEQSPVRETPLYFHEFPS